MNKIFLIMLTGMFMLSFTSAYFEFDNYYTYDESTRTATFKNGLTFGSKIAEIKLNTPLDMEVEVGYNYVFELETWGDVYYSDFVRGIYVHNKRSDYALVNRNIDLKYFNGYETKYRDVEGCINPTFTKNGTSQCNEFGVIDIEEYQAEVWDDLLPRDLKKNDHLIVRGYTNVEVGDKMEWYIDFFGAGKNTGHGTKGVKEWSGWTAALNVSLITDYPADELSGDLLSERGTPNLPEFGTVGSIESGVFGRARGAYTTSDYFLGTLNSTLDIRTGSIWSVSVWYNVTDTNSSQRVVLQLDDAIDVAELFVRIEIADNKLKVAAVYRGVSSQSFTDTVNVTLNQWNNVIVVHNSSGGDFFVFENGAFKGSTGAIVAGSNPSTEMSVGKGFDTPTPFTNGYVDDIHIWNRALNETEVLQIFEFGQTSLEVSLTSPANNTIQSDTLVEFNWTITPVSLNITNWTLSVFFDNGTLLLQEINTTINANETTVVLHNETITDGNYIWNVESCGVNSDTVCGLSENRTFSIDTLSPLLNITSPPDGFIVTMPLQNITINFTINDSGGTLDQCWLNTSLNSTPVFVVCADNVTSALYPASLPNNVTLFLSANDTAGNVGTTNVTIFFQIDWGAQFVGSEYQLILVADNINQAGLEINNVIVTNLSNNVFKINTSNPDDEVSRALVVKTLFYGTDGSDPRATSTYITNPTNVFTNDLRDNGKRGTLSLFAHSGSPTDSSYTGTFSDVSTNNNCSSWSYLDSTGGLDVFINYSIPIGTVVNSIPVNTDTTIDETGTDRSADQKNNPINTQIIGHSRSGEAVIGRAIYLCSGDTTWVTSGLGTTSTIDFLINESFPEMQFTQGRISLDTPIDNSILTSPLVEFSCSVDIVNFSLISNVSLFTNESGVWEAKNTTIGLSTNSTTQSWNRTLADQNDYIWNCEACDDQGSCGFYPTNYTFSIDALPPGINITSPIGTLNFNSIGGVEALNVTFNDTNLDTCWFDYNGTNITIDGCVSGIKNSTNLILEDNNFNLTAYANDTSGNENNAFTSWNYKVFQKNVVFDNPLLVSTTGTYNLFFSSNGTLLTIPKLIFNSVNTTATLTNNGDGTFNISASRVATDTDPNPSLFNFSISVDSTIIITSANNQTINTISLENCSEGNTSSYLHITFRDETTQLDLNASVSSSIWDFFIDELSEAGQFLFTSLTEEPSYDFCFSPDTETYTVDIEFPYLASLYPQRVFRANDIVLTNTTTNTTLYLLSDTEGFFTTYVTINSLTGSIESGVEVTVQKDISGVTTTISQGITDDTGLLTLWLDPDDLYSFTFIKEDFNVNQFNIRPSSPNTYTISMIPVQLGSEGSNGTLIGTGLDYEILPSAITLSQNTIHAFSFQVNRTDDVDSFTIVLSANGSQIFNGTNIGNGIITTNINTSGNISISGTYTIVLGNETFQIFKVWTVTNITQGDFSLDAWMEFGNELAFDSLWWNLFRYVVILITLLTVGFGFYHVDPFDSSIGSLAAAIIVVWLFGTFGWLSIDTPLGTAIDESIIPAIFSLTTISFIIWRWKSQ